MEGEGEKRDVRRPMNAFLIFCKRHRSMVREKNPDLDNRSVTRILGDLWANLKEVEKSVYTDLAKQYKDAFMKANPDYKWHNPDKSPPSQKLIAPKPTNMKLLRTDMDLLPEGSIMPGKLADPSNMGGLSMLILAGQHNVVARQTDYQLKLPENREPSAGTKIPDTQATAGQEPVPETKITDSQKAVEDAINRRLCESLKYGEKFVDQGQKHIQPKVKVTTEQNVQNLGPSNVDMPSSGNNFRDEPSLEWTQPILDQRRLINQDAETADKATADKVDTTWKLAGKDLDDSGGDKTKSKNTALLQLAEMCSNALGHKKPPLQPFSRQEIKNGARTMEETTKPSVPMYKGILAEALLDTCSKGNYPNVIKGGHIRVKSESASVGNELGTTKSETDAVGNMVKLNNAKNAEILSNENDFLKTSVSEKSEISRILVADVKKEDKNEEEESAMVTCGKMVVNHIIDKLYFSDLATAARRAACDKQENGELQSEIPKPADKTEVSVKLPETIVSSKSQENTGKTGATEKQRSNSESSGISNRIGAKNNGAENNFDEHDGGKGQGQQTKPVAAQNKADKYVSKSLKDKILSRVLKEKSMEDSEGKQDLKNEVLENKDINKEVSENKDTKSEIAVNKNIKNEITENNDVKKEKAVSPEFKTDTKMSTNDSQVVNRKRTISQNSSNSGMEDIEGDEKDDFHPVRKSKRRNRGQRYQELINEGIIQPSKERMAAIMHDSKNDSGEVEDFQSIDSHILPETAIRRIRKRTISESDKGRLMSPEEAKRYKTGDFDLEAHIATLPACSIENLGKKRGFARQRHCSETCPNRKPEDADEPAVVIDMEKTVSLPPHIKIPTPEKIKEPVIGSRKRKARKHSITHLLPAPTPTVVSSNQTKYQKELQPSEGQTIASQNSDMKLNHAKYSDSAPDDTPGQQTVSLDSNKCSCKENAETDKDIHSNIVDYKSTVLASQANKDSRLKVNAFEEKGSEMNKNIGRKFSCTEKEAVSGMTAVNVLGRTGQETESLHRQNVEPDTLKVLEESCNKEDSDSAKHEVFKLPCNMEDRSSKFLENVGQCKVEGSSGKMDVVTDPSDSVKSLDLLKETRLLYSDDLVLEEKVAIRSENSELEHINNVCGFSRGRGMGKNLVEPFSDKKDTNVQFQDIYLQNKENVINTETVKTVSDCDMVGGMDLLHSEKQLSNDMYKKTLDQGQITHEGMNLCLVSENRSCDNTVSSAIGADAKDVNFNSKVQSHLN